MPDINTADLMLMPFDGEGEPEYVGLVMGGPTNAYVQPNGSAARYATPESPYFGTAWPFSNPSQNVVRFFREDACLYGTLLHHDDGVSVMLSLGYEKPGVHKVVVDRIILKNMQSFDADLGDGRSVNISAQYTPENHVFTVYVKPAGFSEGA